MKNLNVFACLIVILTCLTGCPPDPEPTPPSKPSTPEGTLCGEFSVSSTKKVYFSKGNLMYLPVEKRFRLHENQNDCCGTFANVYTNEHCETWNKWIDLFFWGTSGWSGGVKDYRPGTRYDDNTYFYINGDMNQDMTGNYARADWGVYNKIENGGNKAGIWRVLTHEEWVFLMSRKNAWTRGYYGSVNGIIIFPDNFETPQNIDIVYFADKFAMNNWSGNEWKLLESKGVAFLPGCGVANYLAGTLVIPTPDSYWSATTGTKHPEQASYVFCDDEKIGMADQVRNLGLSVRLVQDVK